jgi:hypothetical protein
MAQKAKNSSLLLTSTDIDLCFHSSKEKVRDRVGVKVGKIDSQFLFHKDYFFCYLQQVATLMYAFILLKK